MRNWIDTAIVEFDCAVRALGGSSEASRPIPEAPLGDSPLSDEERRHAAGLMRVNHVGEVCAQALYRAQALATRNAELRAHFHDAARDETDHLAWTSTRLAQLQARPSLLNPLWYLGAYTLGLAAARAGDALSLGFVVETERQVEEHLEGHLEALPARDAASRAIVARMRDDEARHGQHADARGARALPAPLRAAMRAAARVMTRTAYWI